MNIASKPMLDPYSHEFHWDPYPHYQAVRDADPVYFNEQGGFWLLTRWDDVNLALRDFRTFINTGAIALEKEAGDVMPYPMFIGSDPPDHTRQRKVLGPLMTPQALARLDEYVRRKTRALLQPRLASGRFDFVADLGCYLPMDVISSMIRVPEADQDRVRELADDLIAREDMQHELSKRNIDGYVGLATYFETHVAQHAQQTGGSDMLSLMMKARAEGAMTHKEVIGNMILLAVAGNETTTKLIGNMAYRLWQHPQQRELCVRDPSMIGKAVEETLRYDGSSQIIVRRVGQDVVLRGKHLKKGDRVGLCLISANRDERHYQDADVYDISRGARDHMAFGFGLHSCLGAALARLETRVVFEEILKAIPDYQIVESGLQRAHNPNVRGFSRCPSTFAPRP
jgi:cytochrome P450